MISKEELLANVDKYYEEAWANYYKEKAELIQILSPPAAKAAQFLEMKSKEDWLKDELEKYDETKIMEAELKKEKQRKMIQEMMKSDEELGLYNKN